MTLKFNKKIVYFCFSIKVLLLDYELKGKCHFMSQAYASLPITQHYCTQTCLKSLTNFII